MQTSLTQTWFRLTQTAKTLRISMPSQIQRMNTCLRQILKRIIWTIFQCWINPIICFNSCYFIFVVWELCRIYLIWLRLSNYFIFAKRWRAVVANANRIVNSLKWIIRNYLIRLPNPIHPCLINSITIQWRVSIREYVMILIMMQICIEILAFWAV